MLGKELVGNRFSSTFTFLWSIQLCLLPLPGLPEGKDDNLQERNGHGEEHPDVNHLDVGGCEECLGYADEAG